ncbi:MAG: DoxX family protein [Symploca sp. SIO2B6]|nr:DoxX family protein [Symploca sp. SIO2B6]
MTSTTETNPSVLTRLFKSESTDNFLLQLTGLIVRVAVGLLMIHNGVDKLGDVQGFADNVVAFIGLPFPVFFTYCAAYTEIVGSVLLVLGFFTRLDAALLLVTMAVAIFFHLKADGFKIMPLETASLYAMLFLYFMASGGGALSIDALLTTWMASDE